uniref:SPIN-DOC-like zinc-finger domain-containing protein n=1 Tax=Echeneis naucrates TaxID=173247 RepID=A0A665VZF8_ECHNA
MPPRGATSKGPDHPLLLSPIPGPSGRKPRVQRASRPGLSRIPGRDHRRYYHEYWRSEYLMDFDPQRHGMICMVCGSSLATLKLSTIKRHIRQKHPDSLLWSTADKEVIRSGWENHLSMGGGHRSYSSTSTTGPSCQEEEGQLDSSQHAGRTVLYWLPAGPLFSPVSTSCCVPLDLPGPSAQTLERYLNDSLHAWFRQEFLMEYEAEAGRLLCMVCGGELPSLHLDHIKSHVLDTHPNSLVYSSEEKHCILQAWAQTHASWEVRLLQRYLYPEADDTLTQDTRLIGEDGGVGVPQQGPQPLRQASKRQLHGGDPWRLRLDYLVAYGPQGQDTFCMVCSQVLHETKVSSFRRHIQECHPDTTTLSRQEREAMAAAWTKDYFTGEMQSQDGEVNDDTSLDDRSASKMLKKEGLSRSKWKAKDSAAISTHSRHGHYPGKDQRRNYQVRWRLEYLMDYDCRRHGLICIVCGATLATLKVSTIKRHIQQVHPHSLDYSPEEKQQALLSYNQTALHFIHSDDCFSTQDHGHTDLDPSPAQIGT